MVDSSAIPFPPRQRGRSLAQEVVDDLTAKICESVYQPGAKLPTEPELMAVHGVSRSVVREALSRLQASRLVKTRHGVGTFVLEQISATLPKVEAVTTLRDVIAMLELRVSLEAEAAALAAERREENHLVAMRAALETFSREIAAGRTAVEPDFQFHLQVALATGNRFFEEFLHFLGTSTIPRTRLDTWKLSFKPSQSFLSKTQTEHGRILLAIERRDPRAARTAMRKHLADSRERLRRILIRNESGAFA